MSMEIFMNCVDTHRHEMSATQDLEKRVLALVGSDADVHIDALRDEAHAILASKRFDTQHRRYAALGDPKRLAAVGLIKRRGELCACEIQAALGLSHATISFHMDALLEADLVVSERRGKWTYYRLSPSCDLKIP
jgi:ArsR family transcriptional regulator